MTTRALNCHPFGQWYNQLVMQVEISVGLAFLAGMASFLAPCVLPLTPAYLSYLSGHAMSASGSRSSRERLFIIIHAACFVLGFTLIFIALGTLAGALGAFLRGPWLRYLGGTLMVFFGLALVGALRMPVLERDAHLPWRARPEWGFASSLLMGMVFAAGWTPCVGPALSAILMLSAQQETAGQGALLLGAYAAGVGLPFMLAALLVDQLNAQLHRIARYLPLLHKITGLLLVLMGIVILTDSFGIIGGWLEQWGIGWDLGI